MGLSPSSLLGLAPHLAAVSRPLAAGAPATEHSLLLFSSPPSPLPTPLAPSLSLPLGLALCAPTAPSLAPLPGCLSAHPLAKAAFPGRAVMCSHL